MRKVSPSQARASSLLAHGLSSPLDSSVSAAERLVGLHNTTQTTPYFSLRARLPGFARAEFDKAMWHNWELARFRGMRLTMFVFPTHLLEIAAAATRHLTDIWAERWLRNSSLSKATFARIADEVEAALTGNPMTVRDLRAALDVEKTVDLPGIVGRMCDEGRLVGGAPPRSWRSSVRRYHRWSEVLPDVDPYRWDEEAAREELIRRYVDAYGPVTLDDVSWWTGMAKTRCREALGGLELEGVDVDGWPGPLWQFGEIPAEAPDTIKALPVLDPYVQGYRDRERLIDPPHVEYVWDRGGNATSTILHGGRIVGVWQTVATSEAQLLYHFFANPPPSVRKTALRELEAAGRMYFDKPADMVEVADINPLHRGTTALHPLADRSHRQRQNG